MKRLKTMYIKVMLDEDMKSLLEKEAERRDLPVSQIVRDSVRGYFAHQETAKEEN